LRTKPEQFVTPITLKVVPDKRHRFQRALDAGITTLENAPPLPVTIRDNLVDGFRMAMSILPTILSVGLMGLLLAKYTPLFDFLAFLLYPIAKILRIPDAMLLSKAVATGIAEMFLPSLMVGQAALITRFVTAVTSVSSIIFFSASIPCILSTEIPITVPELVLIWLERSILSIILSGVLAYLFL